ncbi:DNA repair protein RadA [Gottschalkia acidurici 9a]|uniref:DNA repair protein RadA n=1 Tax=Gottschalkia acidurici (strain ATCC 7906 / DSM 604 / BCRC 14475 / CIP 104303 / KCTC 5404 / NCIMB 10678 / 9a) TaxID=1128398 RepID=K0B1E7_GOTA9|nr:DNA repair protein RadA [Gottschalkia acidurici]AFS79319.1 DNA repair protein RadA [Gottschalkia acidurici 9a]
MAKLKNRYSCQECGHESLKWLGKCPSCNSWNSFVEEIYDARSKGSISPQNLEVKVEKLVDIKTEDEERIKTGLNELDRVLGGGIVKGSLTLIGGDPGIGKSTLSVQVANNISNMGFKTLYVSGEESAKQIKMRSDRLGIKSDELFLLPETNLDIIMGTVEKINPDILIIDSIQTAYNPNIESAPGSVSQVRDITSALMRTSKSKEMASIIIGHVTKEGSIAGPRVLEHMVDTVLYFEGERHNTYRLLRGVKNRFGSTNEIGIFEMRDIGLVQVKNPSEMLLTGRPQNTAGTVVVPSVEGTRPMLVEVQALVSNTLFGMPRRVATGIDYNRVVLMIAVLEKKVGLHLQNSDAYINIVGGLQIKEPAMDLGIVCAIASSFKDVAVDSKTVVMGEVGLTGELRTISFIENRIKEASKLGFERAIVPMANLKGLGKIKGIEVIGVANIEDALRKVLGG